MIFSLCWKGYRGTDQALTSLAQSTGLTRHLSFHQAQPGSLELNFFLDHLRQLKPRCLILGAWTPAYEPILQALHSSPTRLAFYWTSSAGQVDISQEAPILADLLQDTRFAHRLFSSQELARSLPTYLQARFLPVTLAPAALAARVAPPVPKNERPTLTLFCSPSEVRRKNVLNSLLAVNQLEHPPRLLLNGLSTAPGYDRLLEALGLEFEDLGQMPEEDFQQAIAGADLGLQVSFADSFNQVAAQHLLAGVPVLGSAMLPVLDALSPELRLPLVVTEADSPTLWAGRLRELLQDRGALGLWGQQARDCLLEAQRHWVLQARHVLEELA